ncbi:hypothetical protein VC180_24310, partial [Citrobacter braakii]|uniref:hypothetical protein n=1 Tax=Citrobacter braakii TaxID=57706 RepID=UPI002B3919AA
MKRDVRSLLLSLRGYSAYLLRQIIQAAGRGHRPASPSAGGDNPRLPVPFHFRFFRVITWVNIVCQLGFPLALAFTPSV